ncbi:hypothetical protein CI102_7516 [Trichoderma harzianum]|uniref:Uncharacterized protein n=1 Tax=Trichoderma harzianum CBS 226.95 TaxID=983964 RepID=A0A2T4ABT1_TRIHA|nr:hypothetical protein M431DRAFT_519857 [Trichoderma harzianum CBS 226.95]PKK50414.1 hypothetical protein CI102_7516 [Trichoderma harzianum]PTB54539.1 hypothetical protein M431DRAFT_519857 [Trichoderma harzianum CBS 226.95]
MQFSKLLNVVACLATTALAGSETEAPTELLDNGPQVLACNHVNFQDCWPRINVNINTCQDVPASMSNKISSIQPNAAAGACRFFNNRGCEGPSFIAAFPCINSLPAHYPGFNDNIQSFECFH